MTSPARRPPPRPLVVALYLNAGLLACILVAVVSRRGSEAIAAPAGQPIAGGNGMYLMPGQLAQYNWGTYVLDTDRQSLMVYEYAPGTKQLRLVAARDIRHDRDLKAFNTTPSPEEIERIVRLGRNAERGPNNVDPNNTDRRPEAPGRDGVPDGPPPGLNKDGSNKDGSNPDGSTNESTNRPPPTE